MISVLSIKIIFDQKNRADSLKKLFIAENDANYRIQRKFRPLQL